MHNIDHIQTTHVGSLPRPVSVTDLVFAREAGDPVDEDRFDAVVREAVNEVVARQADIGIDWPSDGEFSKISYATYIKERLTGFAGDSPRKPPADLAEYPDYMRKIAASGGTPTYKRPCCVGPITVKDLAPLNADIDRFREAMGKADYRNGFMNAASPGVIAQFQPSTWHSDHDSYIADLADAMRVEYETIARAGLVLQIDAPDLALGRHVLFPELSDEEFLKLAARNIEVLNAALADVPREQIRLHVCWGNYEGPHTRDIAMEQILPLLLSIKAQALLFETANPRHAHEWRAWDNLEIPDDLVLVPGVVDSTTNYVEHPRVVADRILKFTNIAGRERVVAGTDCGFATFAGFGAVDGEIAFAKLGALVEGARMASEELWSQAGGRRSS